MAEIWQFNPYVGLLWSGAVLSSWLAWQGWQKRTLPNALPFLWLMVMATLWQVIYGIQLGGKTLGFIEFWAVVEYFPLTLAPPFAFIFILHNIGLGGWVTRRRFALIFAMPLFTQLAMYTNHWHGLVKSDFALLTDLNFNRLTFTPGILYWLYLAYLYSLVSVSLVIQIRAIMRAPRLYRDQLGANFVAFLLPTLGSLLYLSNLNPIVGLDWTPLAASLAGVMFLWSLTRYQFLESVPLARELVIESMDDPVLLLSQAGRILDVNPMAAQVLDSTPNELIGQPASVVFAPYPTLAKLATSQQRRMGDFEIVENNQTLFFNVQVSPVLNGQKQHLGLLMVLRDVTEQKIVADALQEAYDFQRTLIALNLELNRKLELTHVNQIALDVAIRITNADAGFIAIKHGEQYVVDQFLGRYEFPNADRSLPAEQGLLPTVIQRQTSEMLWNIQNIPPESFHSPSTQSLIVSPLVAQSRVVGILQLETDDPQRFKSQTYEMVNLISSGMALAIQNALLFEERASLIQELEAFGHTVAHDLKNPISNVMGYVEFLMDKEDLEEGEVLSERQKRYYRLMMNNSHKMIQIINELMLLSGIRQRQEIPIAPLNTPKILDEVKLRLQRLIDESAAEITIIEPLPATIGYAPWVEEIWVNYISNAIKYGGKPPLITIGGTEEGEMIRFWVKDNGEGIAPEVQARLFTPFTRLNEVRAQGHGLGLSIVRRIVDRLNGEVRVESSLGEGSTFSFTLPKTN